MRLKTGKIIADSGNKILCYRYVKTYGLPTEFATVMATIPHSNVPMSTYRRKQLRSLYKTVFSLSVVALSQ